MMFRAGLPVARAGQRIGLLGGSFDPPHVGHVHLTLRALRAFGLSQVWWLVSPGNPLKTNGPAPMEMRIQAAEALVQHPRIKITDIEARMGTRYTTQTLAGLRAAYPGVQFTWLMGADNLASIHHWEQWPSIFAHHPVGVIARPGDPIWARTAHAARLFRDDRLDESYAPLLGGAIPPAWCYLPGAQVEMSSTTLRKQGKWPS